MKFVSTYTVEYKPNKQKGRYLNHPKNDSVSFWKQYGLLIFILNLSSPIKLVSVITEQTLN